MHAQLMICQHDLVNMCYMCKKDGESFNQLFVQCLIARKYREEHDAFWLVRGYKCVFPRNAAVMRIFSIAGE